MAQSSVSHCLPYTHVHQAPSLQSKTDHSIVCGLSSFGPSVNAIGNAKVQCMRLDMCRGMRVGMCRGMCVDMCRGMCVDMCRGMRVDMCRGLRVDMCQGMCVDMCRGVCVDMCRGMRVDMCRGMCVDMCRGIRVDSYSLYSYGIQSRDWDGGIGMELDGRLHSRERLVFGRPTLSLWATDLISLGDRPYLFGRPTLSLWATDLIS